MGNGVGSLSLWPGLLPNADRLALDTHPYFAFNGDPNTAPINITASDGQMGGTWPQAACSSWQQDINDLYVTVSLSFLCRLVDLLFQGKPPSVSLSPENIATASMIAASI